MVFSCGLMNDASPLVNRVYQTFCDHKKNDFRSNMFDFRVQSESRLKRLGKELENTNLFYLLYSESEIPLTDLPLQNSFINWFDHSEVEENKMTRNVHIPSRHFEFRNLKEKLCDLQLPSGDLAKKSKCFVSISNPVPEVTESLLYLCCKISQVQEITNLWIEDVKYHMNTEDMKLRLNHHTLTLTLFDCKLPKNLTEQILTQLKICREMCEISIRNVMLGNIAYLIPKAGTSWDSSLLEVLHLDNCSIPGEICCEIMKSLAMCQHITHLSLAENHVGTSGRYLAKAIFNWEDAPLLERLYLDNCSMQEDSCCEILKSFATCKHITHLDLSGNYIGTAGKYLVQAIINWGDTPLLEELYLEKCSIPKEECCKLLRSLTNLIRQQRLRKLSKLVLNENQLHAIEDEVGQLLSICVATHRTELQLCLYRNCSSTIGRKCALEPT